MRAVLALLAVLAATPSFAVEPNERLADPALEARARILSRGLRCLVCQNESIDESHADLAHDVRILLRERLVAGDSDDAAMRYITARYGDFVLLQPPLKGSTLVLWLVPPTLLTLALTGVILAARRRTLAVPAPLTAEEQTRLAALMKAPD